MGGLIQFFTQNPLAIPLFLVMFTAIIAVHEFGHYLTARLLGMRVLEFAFGFPPRIAAIRHAGIDYSVNAIPFGGFVRILGQDDFSIEQRGAGDGARPQRSAYWIGRRMSGSASWAFTLPSTYSTSACTTLSGW